MATVKVDAFLGEMKLLPISFAPCGMMTARGQSLAIGEYSGLFAVIGNRFGGNGINSFNLPTKESDIEGMEWYIVVDSPNIPSRE